MAGQRLRRRERDLLLSLLLVLVAFAVIPVFLGRQRGLAAAGEIRGKPADVVRDWTLHPAVVEIDTKHDIYALGDIHGDYERALTLLTAARVIAGDPGKPELVRWTAGKAILVCTGDFINKGKEALRVIALLRALKTSAREAGGNVIVTMGNHEAGFLADPTRERKGMEFVRELKKTGLNPRDVAAGRDMSGVGEFLRQLPFAARVNDWFFAHAGNTHGRTLKQLQTELQQGVAARGFKAEVLSNPDSLLAARLHPQPWWEKPGDEAAASKARLEGYARALGVKHFVLGHQPGNVTFAGGATRKAGEIYQTMDGLVFLIDVGMSRAVGYSQGALLHVQLGNPPRATAIFPQGPPRRLWPAP